MEFNEYGEFVKSMKVYPEQYAILYGKCKFTESEILEIRRLYKTGKYTQQMLASINTTRQARISEILNNKTWSHI